MSCWALTSCSETEEKEQVVGYGPYARRNPYLAAERYLVADGHEVKSISSSLEFSPQVGVLFSPASSMRSVGEAKRLLSWVGDGGHFVCFLERGEDYFSDVGEWSQHDPRLWGSDDEEENRAVVHLLKELELEKVAVAPERKEEDETASESDFQIKGGDKEDEYDLDVKMGRVLPYTDSIDVVIESGEREFTLQVGGNYHFKPTEGYYVDDWHETADKHRFMSRSYGDGRVTFISDARAFRNPYLGMNDHAVMLDFLADTDKEVVFSLGKVPGFMALLTENAWRALWALLLLLVIWLWKNLPRFGPLLEVTTGHSRNYAEQVTNTGKFLWKHKCDADLLEPLRAAVRSKAGFHGDVGASDLVDKLSEASSLSKEQITEAMTRTNVHDANTMVKISQTLQTLLKSL